MKLKIDQISLAELESAARKRSSVGDVDIFSGGWSADTLIRLR
jgi:hypothetical protein